MKKFTNTIVVLLMLFASIQTTFADHLSGSLQMTARMTGAQEVPSVAGPGQGLCIFTLSLDKQSIAIEFAGADLTGPIMGIHVHEGAPGTNGPVVFDLSGAINGCRVSTVLSGISASERAKFLAGDYYLNVHTAANPGGEIRAQILLETDFRYTAYLKGSNEVPAVTTDALGWGSFNLSKAGYELEINVSTTGLSGPITGAHLHLAPAGSTGGVIEDLTPFIQGASIVGAVVDPSAYAADIAAGNVYINVHTAANPGGEIRAQLVLQPALTFDAYADGAQAGVATAAFALGTVNVDYNLSTLTFHLIADGLSGPIMSAHIHAGGAGSTGGVVYDLTSLINGDEIIGMLPLTDIASLNAFLSGEYYWNIHTDANPNGEIRGQVYKLARENYSYIFGPENEVPPSDCDGTGVGMVTIDRGQSNAHYMMVVCEMTEPIAAAHFHNAPAGSNGGVIFDLGPSFANFNNVAAYGYWTEPDFTSAQSVMFRNNEVYANIHTDSCPNGAIRGDSVRGRDMMIADSNAIPTMSEWGLILLALLTLTFITLAVGGAQGNLLAYGIGINESITTVLFSGKLPLNKLAFIKALLLVGLFALTAAIATVSIYGTITMLDFVGTIIAGPVLAYLIQLLVIVNEKSVAVERV